MIRLGRQLAQSPRLLLPKLESIKRILACGCLLFLALFQQFGDHL